MQNHHLREFEDDSGTGAGDWSAGPFAHQNVIASYRELLSPETRERLEWWAGLTAEERESEMDETERTARYGATNAIELILMHALAGKSLGRIAMNVQKTSAYVREVLLDHGLEVAE